jgi:hypothetical protein
MNPEYPRKDPHPMKIKLNSWTGLYRCRFLEWTGWYNVSLSQRLLGHYRLYQHYKVYNSKWNKEYSDTLAYILQYKATQSFKYFICRIISFVYSTFTRKEYYLGVEVAGINRQLLNEWPAILQEFLVDADIDFDAAMIKALQQINDPSFLNKTPPKAPAILVQFKQENNTHYQPIIRDGIKGKEKGVFSKKQMLIFFDLLAEPAHIERIDFNKPNKYDGLADLLHALTGKGKETFIEALNDYKTRSLYEYNTDGELSQLLTTLTNLADTFRKAGFRSIANLADRKIKELESRKKD